ncbi:MAG: FAD-binding protein [Rhodospirillales bacterium]|jgi:choline dehydrogenase|nr:FAD-binding protein [Rhodospirillaceae bacterium]MBT7770407.1 FAD-binding protein [Rhodospirillales bacterium]MBT5035478.1 FAD-binding protein [Rhodospirillaceae bacterium]MBT6219324.1 FAD-binding protein [Rhodospirillaceae bacterium]MBT6361315.1 FAD-binding protein [Rhodospirillaceae bacterium]
MEFDYIIIGAGSAGCVLANRLSADGKSQVCLLEAGGEDRNPWIHIPVGYVKTMVDPSVNWLFETKPHEATGNRNIPVPRGKVMGGSSAINGMLYVRGQARDYDTWAQQGCTGWSYSDVLPYFKRSENREQGDDDYHGVGGPLNVTYHRERYPVLNRVIDAGGELGYPTHHDYNGASQAGFSHYQVTQKNGRRWSAKNAFINPIRKQRQNLRIETRAFVKKVLIEDGKATGVIYEQHSQELTLKARCEVILAAGSVQSPQLLELSGIGQGDRLQELGVEIINDLPGVGENLHDHYISRLCWQLKNVTSLNQRTRGLPLVGEVLKYLLFRKGALTVPAGMVAGFVKSNPDLDEPDIQYHIANATFKDPKKRVFDRFPGMTIGPCQMRPESRGHVHAVSPNYQDAPEIAPNFLTHPTDRAVHVAGMKIAREIMATDLMRSVIVTETVPGAEVVDDQALLDFAAHNGATIYHPVGTCKMGIDDRAVVDPELRVRGVKGLRVVDASVMPRLTSGNTNAPVIMIAEKAADMIIAANR